MATSPEASVPSVRVFFTSLASLFDTRIFTTVAEDDAKDQVTGVSIAFQGHPHRMACVVPKEGTVSAAVLVRQYIGRLEGFSELLGRPTKPWHECLAAVLPEDDVPRENWPNVRLNLVADFHGSIGCKTANDAPGRAYTMTVPSTVKIVQSREALATLPKIAEPFFTTVDASGVAREIGRASNVLIMCGAGISVAAGIPDFRTPGIGLYSNLAKYDLPEPADLFTLEYLREKPQVFYTASNEMKLWPGSFAPTHVHRFLRAVETKGKLLRCYTQNIDGMERLAGVSSAKLVEAHGTFSAAHCIDCNREMQIEVVKAHVDRMEVPRCHECGGIVKPDVVFFGENLPARFWSLLPGDLEAADLIMVIGTSLQVQPFASIHDRVPQTVPRVLINMHRAGSFEDTSSAPDANLLSSISRDAFLRGDCQAAVQAIATVLGWPLEAAQVPAEEAAGAQVAAAVSQHL